MQFSNLPVQLVCMRGSWRMQIVTNATVGDVQVRGKIIVLRYQGKYSVQVTRHNFRLGVLGFLFLHP